MRPLEDSIRVNAEASGISVKENLRFAKQNQYIKVKPFECNMHQPAESKQVPVLKYVVTVQAGLPQQQV